MLENIGEYWLLMLRVFEKPERWRIFWRQYVNEAHKLIISSIPIVSIISLFIGAVLVLQTAYNIENPFIPKMYVGYMTRESLALEFCSTMVALILAGKIGSNISSEIGSMRITEQIDAMEIMGINSAKDSLFCDTEPSAYAYQFYGGAFGRRPYCYSHRCDKPIGLYNRPAVLF